MDPMDSPVFINEEVGKRFLEEISRLRQTPDELSEHKRDELKEGHESEDVSNLEQVSQQAHLSSEQVWQWLRTPPIDTVVRVNTLKTTREEVKDLLVQHCDPGTVIQSHNKLEEVVVIRGSKGREGFTLRGEKRVVVGEMCGLAVLRGADVFCPGILSVSADIAAGDSVAVYADVRGECLRGAKQFSGEVWLVGRGEICLTRDQLFKGQDSPRGVGVRMVERLFSCPSLDTLTGPLAGKVMLQNLPSLLAVDLLDPKPGERVLDMCSAPGGKTTHIAARMEDKGPVVAFDKSLNKVSSVRENCARLGTNCVRAFVMDGTKSVKEVSETKEDEVDSSELDFDSPPFPPGYFDRVLLDAPCSGLGQRPQFYNKMKPKELNSFPKIQRKLMRSAVELLKPGGVLVYSTCTNHRQENEGLVEWTMEQFECLTPVILDLKTGNNFLNFGHPTSESDTISFFVAKFVKN